jgi:hypothetical protein
MAIKEDLGGNLGLVIIGTAAVMSSITAYMLIQGHSASWIFIVLTIFSFLLLFYFVSITAVIRYISKVCTRTFSDRFGKSKTLPLTVMHCSELISNSFTGCFNVL